MKIKGLAILATILLSNAAFAHISSLTKAHPYRGMADVPMHLTGTHQLTITNTTGAPKTYRVSYYLCAQERHCDTSGATFTLAPGQTYAHGYDSNLWVKYGRRGNFTLTATNQVTMGETFTQRDDALVVAQ